MEKRGPNMVELTRLKKQSVESGGCLGDAYISELSN